ncbi:Kelch repeat-containing protein-like protein 5 [Botrytis cinerea]
MLRRAQNDIPSGLDPVKNMCQRWYHSSILKNEILYIYGGYETFVESNNHGGITGSITMGTNNYMIGVKMNESWNWTKASASLPLVSEQVFLSDSESANAFSSVVLKGALFSGTSGGNGIYLYGGTEQSMNTSFYGYTDPTSPNQTLLSYDVAQNQWASIDVDSTIPEKPSFGASADVPDQGLGFYFNGEINNGSSTETTSIPAGSSVPLEGMVMLNMTDNTTRNISTAAIDTNSRTGGLLQYIPGIGANGKGILIQFGGMYRQAGELSDELGGTLAPMDQINIFDINSAYNGGNGSCYNIYLYGGQDGGSVSYDDVFVLSLPSFTWIQVYESVPGSPRFGHTCHLVGNRQMLTVGGAQKKYSSYCDWESSGVAIYDMYALSWKSTFYHDANKYIVPENITDIIGGNSSGFAQLNRPSKDFTNANVASLFSKALLTTNTNTSSTTNTTGSTTANSSATTSAASNNVSHGASTGVIAGATIGVVVAVLIISSLVWVWRRSSAAGRIKTQEGSRTESRQSLIVEDGKALNRLRANVMSMAYDPSNPCRVPGVEAPKEQVHVKLES